MGSRGGLWFGWNGEVADGAARPVHVTHRDGVTYATVNLSRKEYEEYYLGFSNAILWPVFHYFVDNFRYSDEQYAAYKEVNQRLARELSPLLRPHDLIWVHDYHLLLLAQAMRENGVGHPIGLFLHVPFPAIEVLRVLPVYAELLRAMLHYDLLGFQTEADRNGFLSAVAALFGAEAVRSDATVIIGQRRVRAGCSRSASTSRKYNAKRPIRSCRRPASV